MNFHVFPKNGGATNPSREGAHDALPIPSPGTVIARTEEVSAIACIRFQASGSDFCPGKPKPTIPSLRGRRVGTTACLGCGKHRHVHRLTTACYWIGHSNRSHNIMQKENAWCIPRWFD